MHEGGRVCVCYGQNGVRAPPHPPTPVPQGECMWCEASWEVIRKSGLVEITRVGLPGRGKCSDKKRCRRAYSLSTPTGQDAARRQPRAGQGDSLHSHAEPLASSFRPPDL